MSTPARSSCSSVLVLLSPFFLSSPTPIGLLGVPEWPELLNFIASSLHPLSLPLSLFPSLYLFLFLLLPHHPLFNLLIIARAKISRWKRDQCQPPSPAPVPVFQNFIFHFISNLNTESALELKRLSAANQFAKQYSYSHHCRGGRCLLFLNDAMF